MSTRKLSGSTAGIRTRDAGAGGRCPATHGLRAPPAYPCGCRTPPPAGHAPARACGTMCANPRSPRARVEGEVALLPHRPRPFAGSGRWKALWLAASRGPITATLAVLGIYAAASLSRIFERHGRARLVGAVLTVLLLAGSSALVLGVNMERATILERFDRRDPTGNRTGLWSNAWAVSLQHPFLGAALKLPEADGQYHNIVIEGFLTTGVLGGAILVALLSVTSLKAWRLIKLGTNCDWIGLLWFQYLFGAFASGAIYTSFSVWYLCAAVFACYPSASQGLPGCHR